VSGERQAGFVVAATGLRAEALIAARSEGVRAVAGGGDAAQLAQAIEQALAEGGYALISFGVCASLKPGLTAGTCLAGREVVHAGTTYAADTAWTARIAKVIGGKEPVIMAGVDHPLTSLAEKRPLHAASGAVAADMESHIVAEIATRNGLPFAVLRVVADPAARDIPPAALAAMAADGGVDIAGLLAALRRDPAQLAALARLAGDTARAMAGLFRCHHLLGPRLGFPDLG
jgi:adenosylhomocysteine nucleosidase